MLNDPAIHGERITVSDNAKFILTAVIRISLVLLRSITTGTTKKSKALATQYGFICDTRRCTWMLDGLKGSIHQKNKKADYSNVMVSINPLRWDFMSTKQQMARAASLMRKQSLLRWI